MLAGKGGFAPPAPTYLSLAAQRKYAKKTAPDALAAEAAPLAPSDAAAGAGTRFAQTAGPLLPSRPYSLGYGKGGKAQGKP